MCFLKKKFKKNKIVQQPDRYIIAQLNDRILPEDRGIYYEDPLNDYLVEHKLGEVTGGGTKLSEYEVDYVDIEIMLSNSINTLEISKGIIEKLEILGAPKGSKLILEDASQEISFGKKEGLAIFFDSAKILEEDINTIIIEMTKLLNIGVESQRVMYLKNNKTAFYIYINSYEQAKTLIAEFINTNPICKEVEVTQIA